MHGDLQISKVSVGIIQCCSTKINEGAFCWLRIWPEHATLALAATENLCHARGWALLINLTFKRLFNKIQKPPMPGLVLSSKVLVTYVPIALSLLFFFPLPPNNIYMRVQCMLYAHMKRNFYFCFLWCLMLFSVLYCSSSNQKGYHLSFGWITQRWKCQLPLCAWLCCHPS